MNKFMTRIAAAFIAQAVLAAPASAAPILLGSSFNPTGIQNLDVNGTLYDVSFLFADPKNGFTDAEMVDAADALTQFLTAAGAAFGDTFLRDQSGQANVTNNVYLANGRSGILAGGHYGTLDTYASLVPAPLWSAGFHDGSALPYGILAEYGCFRFTNAPCEVTYQLSARFVRAGTETVPEPTTIALLGLGLAGLSVSRRKAKSRQ